MKLYGEAMPAPNPRRVRIFLAEKGLEVPEIRIGLREGGHRSPEHLARNSLGQVPVLELDDGTAISETIAKSAQTSALTTTSRPRTSTPGRKPSRCAASSPTR